MGGTDYEVTAMYVSSLVKGVAAAGLLEPVLSGCSEATREAAQRPFSSPWHPASVAEELAVGIARAAGPRALEELSFAQMHATFGPVVTPLARVALTLAGSSPAALFARLEQTLSVAKRGLPVQWHPEGPRGGEVVVRYPRPVDARVEHLWRGIVRFGFDVAEARGKVDGVELIAGHQLRLRVSW